MIQFELLPELIAHFRLYSDHVWLDLEEFEIEEVLVPWLEKIQAPASLRGLGRVCHALHRLSQDAVVKQRLEHIFGVPDWFLPGLGFSISFSDPKREAEFLNIKMGSGWCEDAPFYAWLFRLTNYNKNPIAVELQLVFLEHYFKTLVELNDPQLSAGSKTREQEVCSATRLVFDDRNQDFKTLLNHLVPTDLDSVKKLAFQVELFCKNQQIRIETKNRNYLRAYVHFLLGNWGVGRHRGRQGLTRMIARRYNKTQTSLIQGQDASIQEILPSLPYELDKDGVDGDDFYPQQLYVSLDSDCTEERDAKELSAVERIFDPVLIRNKSIDVTHKVRRGQNVALQNTELLKSGDLARFIGFLQRSVTKEHQLMALAYWSMLLIGKSPADLANLFVFDDLRMLRAGLYVDPDGYGWWCFPINYSAKPRLDDEKRGLIVTSDHAFTPCPSFYMELLRKHYGGGFVPLIASDITTASLAKRLKKYSDHLPSGQRVSLDKLYSFIDRFCFATGSIDPVVLDFSYHLALSRTRVTRSYVCIDDQHRLSALNKLWCDITQYARSADPSLQCPTFFEPRPWHQRQHLGSTFTPSQAACIALVSHLRTSLNESAPSGTYPLPQVIQYHNAYAAYTAFLLMFATGYRAVHNPLPSLALHLRTYRLLGISDKDDADFTHARLVCMPELLDRQLRHYNRHLQMLAQMLRCRVPTLAATVDGLLTMDEQLLSLGIADTSQWYKTVRNSRRELGPLFHFKSVNRQWQAVNLFPKALSDFLPLELRLPSNAGRHWMKSQLIQRSVDPELIDWQMGHWMTGQAPLGYYSALSHVEVSRYLAPILDEMLQEVGWEALPSKII